MPTKHSQSFSALVYYKIKSLDRGLQVCACRRTTAFLAIGLEPTRAALRIALSFRGGARCGTALMYTDEKEKEQPGTHCLCIHFGFLILLQDTVYPICGWRRGGGDWIDGWSGCDWCAGNQCVAWTPGTIILLKTSVQVHACMRAAGATCRDALTRRRLLSGMHRARSRSVRMRRQVEICWSCCSPSQNCCL